MASTHEPVVEFAMAQDGMISRAQARGLGVDRFAVAHQIASGRWQAYGGQAIAAHRLALSYRARCRVSVWEAGEHAALDGVSSLTWSGLVNFDDMVHVIVPWPCAARRWEASVVHPSRLWRREDIVVRDGMPVTRPEVATVRAGMWARSDRAAATVMAMAVQQRLATGDAVLLEARRLNRHRRRPLLLSVAHDIADGAQSLSELDFARLCRAYRLPEPTRQVVRHGPRGRVYLDATWEHLGLVVEIEGAHHDSPENAIDDSLRQNSLTVAQLGVLRIPVLGLRTCPDLFMEQVREAVHTAETRPTAAPGPPTTVMRSDP